MDILVYKDGRFVCTENPLKAGSLEGLAMLVTNPQDGDVLKYDAASGTWLNGTGSDFAPTITSPQDGQVIKYNGTAWVNGTGGGDFDPTISNPQDGQVIKYDGTKWVNGAASSGSGIVICEQDANNTLNHTWAEITAAPYALLKFEADGAYHVCNLYIYGEFDGSYIVSFFDDSDAKDRTYITSSQNGYPVLDANDPL